MRKKKLKKVSIDISYTVHHCMAQCLGTLYAITHIYSKLCDITRYDLYSCHIVYNLWHPGTPFLSYIGQHSALITVSVFELRNPRFQPNAAEN